MATQRSDTTDPGAGQPASTGIRGLDEILRGGFSRDEMHLVQGGGGTGKTTLALQFLLTGVHAGESALYVTLSQTKRALEVIAHSHGWSLQGVTVHEMSPGSLVEHLAAHQTVLHTAEVELDELTRDLRKLVEQVQPRRIVFDSMGVIGLLAGSTPRYHREIVALRQFLAGWGCTALFLGDLPPNGEVQGGPTVEFHSLATSVVHLEQTAPDYGEVRRRLRVIKVRGVAIHSGYHDFSMRTGGLEVYPRLGPRHDREYSDFRLVPSGIDTLDELLGGGLERGTACLLIGSSGTGKSSLAALYARAVARQEGTSAVFLFEERPETFLVRSKGLGIDLQPHIDDGRVIVRQLLTSEITPGEFAQRVREVAEDQEATLVVIDSLTGYFNAMGNSSMLMMQMHELLTFLSRRGVLTLLVVSQEGVMTIGANPALDVSYLSDSIIALRMFEAEGALLRCLSVIKKRQGEHETTIRELTLRHGGISVGKEPLRQYRNILSGRPEPAGAGQDRGYGGGKTDEHEGGRGE